MNDAMKIGLNIHTTLAGVAINSVVLWALAITIRAGWFVYGLLMIHAVLTATQTYVLIEALRGQRHGGA